MFKPSRQRADDPAGPSMSIDLARQRQHVTHPMDRRQRRIAIPDCPSCQVPLHVDVRSHDTLYARCVWCGHRLMVAKPALRPEP